MLPDLLDEYAVTRYQEEDSHLDETVEKNASVRGGWTSCLA